MSSKIRFLIILVLFLFMVDSVHGVSWWNSSWQYRKAITINNTGTTALNEYQVNLSIDTQTMISGGKLNSDCSDLRFVDNTNNLTDFYIEDISLFSCNVTNTLVWAKVPSIPSSSTETIYMYYGNPNATTSLSDISGTFSYSVRRVVGYVVHVRTAASALNVISLDDNNEISDGTSVLSLNDQGTGSFPASELSMNTAISAKKLFHADGTVDGSDTITPISFAGTEFVDYSSRATNEFHMVSPFGTANVSIYNGGSLVWSGTVTASGSSVNQDITNGNVVRITSDIPILVQHDGNAGDSRLFYPATVDYLYGIPSNYLEIGSGLSGASVTWVTSSGGTGSTSLGADGGYSSGGLGSYGSPPAYRVNSSDYGICVDQLADSDGYETSTFLPAKEMGTTFGANNPAGYITIAAPEPSTTCTVYNSGGSQVGQQTGGTRTDVNKIGFGTGSTSTWVSAGWKMTCDKSVFAYYENDGADTAETNLWSYKQMRQYTYPEPTASIGGEDTPISIVSGPTFTDYPDEHAFNVSAVANSSTGDSEFVSCTVYFDDGTAVYSEPGTLDTGYGNSYEASCNFSNINDSYTGFDIGDSINVSINFTGGSQQVSTSTLQNAIPNRNPSILSGPTFTDYSDEHAFNVSAVGYDIDWNESEISSCYFTLDDGESIDTEAGVLNTSYGSTDQAACNFSKVDTSYSGFEVGEDILVKVVFEDVGGATAESAYYSHTIPNHAPAVVSGPAFNDYTDRHGFNVSAVASDPDGDSDFASGSCTIYFDDGDGNNSVEAGTLNTTYGTNKQAACNFSNINNSYSGFDVEENIIVKINFQDEYGG